MRSHARKPPGPVVIGLYRQVRQPEITARHASDLGLERGAVGIGEDSHPTAPGVATPVQ